MDDIEHLQVGLVDCEDSAEIESLRAQIAELEAENEQLKKKEIDKLYGEW